MYNFWFPLFGLKGEVKRQYMRMVKPLQSQVGIRSISYTSRGWILNYQTLPKGKASSKHEETKRRSMWRGICGTYESQGGLILRRTSACTLVQHMPKIATISVLLRDMLPGPLANLSKSNGPSCLRQRTKKAKILKVPSKSPKMYPYVLQRSISYTSRLIPHHC